MPYLILYFSTANDTTKAEGLNGTCKRHSEKERKQINSSSFATCPLSLKDSFSKSVLLLKILKLVISFSTGVGRFGKDNVQPVINRSREYNFNKHLYGLLHLYLLLSFIKLDLRLFCANTSAYPGNICIHLASGESSKVGRSLGNVY
jgi:hypothetical protein